MMNATLCAVLRRPACDNVVINGHDLEFGQPRLKKE